MSCWLVSRILVQFVLTSMLVYLAMAIDFPPWAIKATDKIGNGFSWRGRKDAKGGHYLVTWTKVCLPRELGVLGISKLQTLGWSLKMRWLWLKEIDPSQPWSMFPIQVHKSVHTSFSMASGQWCWNLILAWQVDSWPTDSRYCTSFLFVTREEQTRGLFLIPHWSCLGLRHPRCFDSRWYHWIPCPRDIVSEVIL